MSRIRSSVAAVLFAVVTVVSGVNGVMTGTVWLSRVFRSVDGLVPALILTGVVLLVSLFALLILLMTGLVLIEMIVGAPQIGSHGAYSLLGVFGIGGVFVSLMGVVTGFSLDSVLVTGSTPDVSLAAWAVFSAPVVLVCSRLVVIGDSWRTDFSAEGRDDVEPVTSKRIDRDASTSDTRTPPINDGESENPDVENRETRLQSGDYEFNWVIGTKVSFDDVGGMSDVIAELRRDVIRPLVEDKERAKRLGITPGNVLFHGPPGTGKTYLSKALATELGVPFAQISGADIQSKWINESADRARKLFQEGERIADRHDGALIFIDEIDSILGSRDSSSRHAEDRKVVNELLAHLQETRENDVIVIGATNRVEALDEAGVRSGRMSNRIRIGLPEESAREEIIRAQLRGRASDVSSECISIMARETEGYSAADIESIIESSAKRALDSDVDVIRDEDLLAVVD